jgi:biopolymer transport protein TolR
MKFHVKRRRSPQIIIVSLIDIFAILLIFFIVTTTFKTAQTQLAIKLPESQSATQSRNSTEPLVIAIKGEHDILFGDKPVGNLDALKSALQDFQAKTPDKPIAMSADKDVAFGFMVQVLDTIKAAGVKSGVSAFTQPKDQK